jgi:hypothetical protein
MIILLQDSKAPLHLAAANGHTDIVAALIMAGADRDAKDNVRHCLSQSYNVSKLYNSWILSLVG